MMRRNVEGKTKNHLPSVLHNTTESAGSVIEKIKNSSIGKALTLGFPPDTGLATTSTVAALHQISRIDLRTWTLKMTTCSFGMPAATVSCGGAGICYGYR